MAVCSLGMTLGVLAFTYAPPQADPCIWAWAVLWGVSFGYLVPMLGAVRGGLFWPGCLWQDLRHHHTSIQSIGGALAPVVAGLARDVSGTYTLAFLIVAIACGLGVVIYAVTGPPKKRAPAAA